MSRRTPSAVRVRPSPNRAGTHARLGGPRSSRASGASAVVALAVVAGYIAVSAAFTGPPGPAQDAAREYFAPYFSQRWDVFAPNMVRVNSALQVQVQWRDADGDLVKSDWTDVTDTELAGTRGWTTPSRISKSSVNALSTYVGRFEELSPAQQERVQDTFIEATDDGFAPIEDAALLEELFAQGSDEAAVIRLVRYDYMLTRFAAAWGQAQFGHVIERVRWRAVYERPNDFRQRFADAAQYEASTLTFGWRQPAAAPDDDIVAIFRDVQLRYQGGES